MHLLVIGLMTKVVDYTVHHREVYLFQLLPVTSDFKYTQGILKLRTPFWWTLPLTLTRTLSLNPTETTALSPHSCALSFNFVNVYITRVDV